MSIVAEMRAAVGCGRNMGHGEGGCVKGWECDQCAKLKAWADQIESAENYAARLLAEYRKALALSEATCSELQARLDRVGQIIRGNVDE